jgi:hypothetical protein
MSDLDFYISEGNDLWFSWKELVCIKLEAASYNTSSIYLRGIEKIAISHREASRIKQLFHTYLTRVKLEKEKNKKIEKLENEIASLNTHIACAPGGLEYLAAKNEYEYVSK